MSTQSKIASDSGHVEVLADEAFRAVLLEIATRFKGTDPEVDARIDAAAKRISGMNLPITSIPAMRNGAPRVPLYFEGEPGVGKTSLIKAAILEFCSITGLNFVENPADDYEPQPNDFYFVTVNLSGKMNASDLGGLPIRTERGGPKSELETSAQMKVLRKTADVGEGLLAEIDSRVRGIAGFVPSFEGVDTKLYDTGALRSMELTAFGDPTAAAEAVTAVLRQVSEDAKAKGVGMTSLPAGSAPLEDRMSFRVTKGADYARVTLHTPRTPTGPEAQHQYVAAMLPNLRFALARQFRFSLFNFDDVANANAQVRNVLLEVAQSNRYSGIMDLGNALVTFTGNMGAEDNTNTVSKQSDAEVTRIRKFRVFDTPKDWARRITEKYGADPDADVHFASFVERQGAQPGIFREEKGAARGKHGVPKTNSRALENAMATVSVYFEMARRSSVSVMSFKDLIRRDVAATAGARVADAYGTHLQSMLTEAIPLAEKLIDSGKLDQERFNKHARNFIDPAAHDFAFRFAAALADTVMQRAMSTVEILKDSEKDPKVRQEKTQEQLAKMSESLCLGLAQMNQSHVNYALSRLISRMMNSPDFGSLAGNKVKVLNKFALDGLFDGFLASRSKGAWTPPAGNGSDPDVDNFLSMLVGNREAHALKINRSAKASV
jgi:hypothetical protein